MTRHARRGTKYQTDEPNHRASRGTMRRWVIGMLFAVIALLPSVGTAIVIPWPDGMSTAQVAAIAVDPTTPSTLYAGTTDGIFKSTNGGGSWQTVNTGLTNLGVNALVLDPAIPTTLYAGTNGGGIFKSTDGGGSWRAVNTGLTYLFVYALALDPTSPNELYVGMYCGCGNLAPYIGIFKSTDGGENWQAVNNGLATLEVFAFAIDPTTPTTLYAGSNGSGVGIGGVFKSTNGGGSWQTASSGLPVAEAVIALAIDPITPTTLYAGTLSGGVFKSRNGGGNWQAVNTGLTNFSSGVYALALDPTNPTTLYAGTQGGGVFRSTDGGGHWQVVPGLADLNVNALALDTTTPITLYAGTWGSGVFRSVVGTSSVIRTSVGVFRLADAAFYLDANGSGAWNGCGIDKCINWGGDPADKVVLGDWNNDGRTKIGIYRNGTWYLDRNGNGTFDGCGTDACISWGGDPTDQPKVGDWNGSGSTKIGVYRGSTGTWYLDTNGNGAWDGCAIDRCLEFGSSEDVPIVGKW